MARRYLGINDYLKVVGRAVPSCAARFGIYYLFQNVFKHIVLSLCGGKIAVDLQQMFDLGDYIYCAVLAYQFDLQFLFESFYIGFGAVNPLGKRAGTL